MRRLRRGRGEGRQGPASGGQRRRAWRWAGLALALAAVVALLPPVQAAAKAAAVGAEAVELALPRPTALEVTTRRVSLAGVEGELHHPRRPSPAVLLVPGATPAGLDDPRTRDLAVALAASGRLVFVPELELYEQRLADGDLERLVDAAAALPEHPRAAGDDLGLLGFSFGGSLALLTAADARVADRIAHVAVLGAYVDFVGVIEAATTGVSLVDGQAWPWEPHPMADEVVREQALTLVTDQDRQELADALDGEVDPDTLPDDAAAIHALVANDDPTATRRLVAALPQEARELLERFSPVHVLDDIAAPITALHDRGDPAVPFSELRRLQLAAPEVVALEVRLFDHVDPAVDADAGALTVAGDALRTWRFAWRLLQAQERALPVLAAASPVTWVPVHGRGR